MKAEYGVDARLERLPFTVARWVEDGWAAVDACPSYSCQAVKDSYGRPVLLFRNEFSLQQYEAEFTGKIGRLLPYALPPDEQPGTAEKKKKK
jgi:peptide chain release factor 3